MHIFLLHGAGVYICISADYINAHIYCISTMCTLSFCVLYAFRTLGHSKWGMEGMKGGERLFLSSLSLVLLGAIMAVMKAHLSPSWCYIIIHNGTAVAVEWGWVCVLFRGWSYMCVQYEDGCLNAISDAEMDLLMYLLSRREWLKVGHIWYKRTMFRCVWSALWAQTVSTVLDQWA